MSLTFEWDQNKSEANERKHGVTFEEAKTVFNDPFAITIDDPDHSDDEYRYIDIGFSSKYRTLVVWYTERNENIRIIGCRKTTKSERKIYEERDTQF
ncbi:MAG: BrnT family toxin [Desulfobacteraceae bacterium]|nr:BrnT family toxin [Desulfobacteraceae bacterium]